VEIDIVSNESGTTATLVGEADADNCALIGAALLADTVTHPLSLDLGGLTFLDSSAISELLEVHNALRQRAVDMSVVGVSPSARRVLEITGLLDHFGISDTE